MFNPEIDTGNVIVISEEDLEEEQKRLWRITGSST
jgi:hypothetical protein